MSGQKLSMECAECLKLGFDSKVQSRKGWTTIAHRYPFTDDDGKPHHHIIEITPQYHCCNNEHGWKTIVHKQCWCGWPENQQ